MSSFKVTTALAAVYGFTPKYAWDEFASNHPKTANRVIAATIEHSLNITEEESIMTQKAKEVLRKDNLDSETLVLQAKANRIKKRKFLGLLSETKETQRHEKDESGLEYDWSEIEETEAKASSSASNTNEVQSLKLSLKKSEDEVEKLKVALLKSRNLCKKWKSNYVKIYKKQAIMHRRFLRNRGQKTPKEQHSLFDDSDDEF